VLLEDGRTSHPLAHLCEPGALRSPDGKQIAVLLRENSRTLVRLKWWSDRVRLMDNYNAWDCAYPGLELLPDGTFVTTTYGHWVAGAEPYLVSMRLTLAELDRLAAAAARPGRPASTPGRPVTLR